MDEVDQLLVEVRASTQGFASDITQMRGAFDSTLTDGFAKAGNVLETGLLGAIRKGSLGFEDMGRIALRVVDQIAARALKVGFDNLFGSVSTGGNANIGGLLGGALGAVFGLPGRATGGPVSPGRGYLVGENGPELFVPTTAGHINANGTSGAARDVKVSINLAAPRGTTAPVALQRSSRQVASAVGRALREA
ncbi:tail tape measure protein [Tsuneonella mangrovi]|uniref:tail tape measure protein n=1 Tax=Tsuneonella mangrovi TaxID=1982042 RepID=UPI000BA23038|nr:tail tape measure protein [Tsuneonella mangrovi]